MVKQPWAFLGTEIVRLQARAKELRLELLNSKRLQAHFEEHPADLALLKHDKPLGQDDISLASEGSCQHISEMLLA